MNPAAMERRSFFKLVAGALAALVVEPVVAAVPAPARELFKGGVMRVTALIKGYEVTANW